jgi:imidazolonepropionase-like amidohydrolase
VVTLQVASMKPIVLSCFLFCTVFVYCQNQLPIDNRQRTLAIVSVNVIPMDNDRVLENQTVVIRDGRIASIDDPQNTKLTKETMIIDGKGKYLIPGLAEMHAHVPPVNDMKPMIEVLLLYALNGVTTIRGMLGHPKHLELRSKLQSGEILGPRFYTSGPSFNGQTVVSPDSGAAMVRAQKKAGYDFLKLHPGLNKEKFDAIAKTAKEVNIPFAGHVSFDVGIWHAINAGYASIDHMDGFVECLVPGIDTMKEQQTGLFAMFIGKYADQTRIPKLMTALRDHRIWVVPTQALAERWFTPEKDADAFSREPEMIYMAPATLNNWITVKKNLMANPNYKAADVNSFIQLRRRLIDECNKNKVGLLLGSDAPQIFNVPGFSLHHELKYLVKAGLTPYEALRTGTVHVAQYFNVAGDMGTIREGAVSDLILLNGNPLQNIDHTRNIAGVMLGNWWLSKPYIDQELKKLEKR